MNIYIWRRRHDWTSFGANVVLEYTVLDAGLQLRLGLGLGLELVIVLGLGPGGLGQDWG